MAEVIVASLSLCDSVLAACVSQLRHGDIGPKWFNIYGPQSHSGGGPFQKHYKHYQKYPKTAPNYRGRILMSLHHDSNKKQKEPEEVHKKPLARLRRKFMPRVTPFILRALVVSGSEMPTFRRQLLTERCVERWWCAVDLWVLWCGERAVTW